MSEPHRPAGPSFNPAWLLVLLVPAALFAGRLISDLPLPAARPAPGATTPGMPSSSAGGAGRGASSGGGQWVRPGDDVAGESAPEPGDAPKPDAAPDAGGPLRWMPLAAAMEEARISGKPVLFDFNAEWCPPCQRMKNEAFANPAIARAVEAAVVPVSIVDRYRETGSNPPEIEELQRRFGIEAFPTLVLLSTTTGRSVQQAGYGGPAATRDWILEGAKRVK